MAGTQVTDTVKANFTSFLTNNTVVTIESAILWLVETLADIQSDITANPSETKEITEYTYNGLTGEVKIALTFQSESWADNAGVILQAASVLG